MSEYVSRARRFVDERFPQAEAAFLGGSAAAGCATDGSDLDILVMLPDKWADESFVETTRFEGQLVEAFVYGRRALAGWLEKGRAERRPVLDRLIGEGVVVVDAGDAESLGTASRRALATGPAALDPGDLRQRAYMLSAVLDDLADAADPGESYVIAAAVWREAAELALLTQGRWIGTGKWLLRELAAAPQRYGLDLWAAGDDSVARLIDLGHAVLAEAGGYLQEGFVRGHRPTDL